MGARPEALAVNVALDSAMPGQSQVEMRSAFQPIYSLSHARLVGHEALLRTWSTATGRPMSPIDFFASLPTERDLASNDAACFRMHLASYAAQSKAACPEWLFLNLHPASLAHPDEGLRAIVSAIKESAVPASSLVVEILESSLSVGQALTPLIDEIRNLGCLIAVDDFGAGHSNFERVFDLSPDIVKLDRHVLLRAKGSAKAKRILERMVSLLHECGSLVLMEGIETLEGGHIALSCDVDLVQGYHFARPEPNVRTGADACSSLEESWGTFNFTASKAEDNWRSSMAWQCDLLRMASERLAGGTPPQDACQDFLQSPRAAMCYLLDDAGRQVGSVIHGPGGSPAALSSKPQFRPLHNTAGARWSRRPYFRRAVAVEGSVQLTRPYLTMQGAQMCLTASIAFEMLGRLMILCGDITVHQEHAA